MRVLIISDSCNPDWPSLPSFTYKYAKAISKHADVVVATQIRNARNLEKTGIGNADIVYINSERVAAPLYKLGVFLRGGNETGWNIQTALDYPSYLAFEWYAWRHFKDELKNGNFDIVHRMTPVQTNSASFMARRCPVPFLIGPINGHLPWPDMVAPVMHREMSRGDQIAKAILKAYEYLPYYKSTQKHSDGILASFAHTYNGLPENIKSKAINFPEVGIEPELFTMPSRTQKNQMTILYVGRLVPLKMPEVLVQNFARSNILRQHKLIFVGAGPERGNLERIVKENNLNGCVEFTGQKSWSEVAALMRRADIFALPSIHELGGGVVVEAMACGLASVIVDYGGPATMIANDRGVKVPVSTPENIEAGFRSELERLVTNPAQVRKLGESANKHAMTFYTWDAKARKTIEIYRWLTSTEMQKPDYWQQPTPTEHEIESILCKT